MFTYTFSRAYKYCVQQQIIYHILYFAVVSVFVPTNIHYLASKGSTGHEGECDFPFNINLSFLLYYCFSSSILHFVSDLWLCIFQLSPTKNAPFPCNSLLEIRRKKKKRKLIYHALIFPDTPEWCQSVWFSHVRVISVLNCLRIVMKRRQWESSNGTCWPVL